MSLVLENSELDFRKIVISNGSSSALLVFEIPTQRTKTRIFNNKTTYQLEEYALRS